MLNRHITRLFDILPYQREFYPKSDCLVAKRNKKWIKTSTTEAIARCDRVSLGLRNLGVQKGDRIALISMNRPEWNFIDFGILQLGAVNVPIYPTSSDEELLYILQHCEAKFAFVEDKRNLTRIEKMRPHLPKLNGLYAIDPLTGFQHWEEILKAIEGEDPKSLDPIKAQVRHDDLASIIYTSGTTGTPKGVMLEHRNILSNALGARGLLHLDSDCRALSFLPLCHIFERMVNYAYMVLGVSIYYAENLATIPENLREVRPMVFVSVPRLIEKVYQKIMARGEALAGVKRKLFDWSLKVADHHDPDSTPSIKHAVELELARALVFSKWREALGGEIRFIISGGAALQGNLARTFAAAGIPLLQGYGLTETSAMCTVNRDRMGLHKLGTVGPAVEGVEVRIAPEPDYPQGEGEIVIRGPNVMRGYYKDDAATSEAIDPEGWFHTGDIGKVVDGIFFKITDRKKEIFKTSGGKYVAPLRLEGKLKAFPLIEQAMIVGEHQKYPAALILPDKSALKDWCRSQGLSAGDLHTMLAHPEVDKLFRAKIQEINKTLGPWEQIKNFAFIADEWSPASGELTPKLSLKRKVIAKKYATVIAKLFNNED